MRIYGSQFFFKPPHLFFSKFKTPVTKQDEAAAIIQMLQPFYTDCKFSFNLNHPDKILIVEHLEDDNHPEMVTDILKMAGFICIDIAETLG